MHPSDRYPARSLAAAAKRRRQTGENEARPSVKPRIAVLYGGTSSDTETLKTGFAVSTALQSRGQDAFALYVDQDVDVAIRQERFDMAFMALPGGWGESGCVQGALELRGIPYTGSSMLACALAMHKVRAKELFRLHNLATPAYVHGKADEDLLVQTMALGLPVVVKPVNAGRSMGVRICHELAEVSHAIAHARRFSDEILIEKRIVGIDVSVAIIDEQPLGGIEIASAAGFYDYATKCTAVDKQFFTPPRITPECYRAAITLALRAYRALGCCGMGCVDMRITSAGFAYVLEVNTMPGLYPKALVPRIAASLGIGFGELCERILVSTTKNVVTQDDASMLPVAAHLMLQRKDISAH
jgi:D-alanine-D-alanine ligase